MRGNTAGAGGPPRAKQERAVRRATLSDAQKQQIRERVAAFERLTGVELVTALLPRCDDYPEIPWKAFALGVAAGATLAILGMWMFPGGSAAGLIGGGEGWAGAPAALITVLGAGLLSAAASLFLEAWGRLFLSDSRAEGEARQAAQVMFLEHELFRTRERTGMLLLVAAFERRVILLADRGLRERLPEHLLDDVVATTTRSLSGGSLPASFAAGIELLEKLLRTQGLEGGAGEDVLPGHLEPGARETQ